MTYKFGPFTLDLARRELRTATGLVAVEPQVFDLLAFMIESRDRVVSRDEILEAVWGGRIVSEATIGSRLNAARAAIGDTGADQRLIRTFPRKGVRFVGNVELIDAEHAARTVPDGTPIPPGELSRLPGVAVLPFANMSGDFGQDFFAEGMAEEIITALSRISGLSVIARNSSFAFRDRSVDPRRIGRELGVGYLLEGSVRRDREQLRISGQLVDAASGATLWAERFDGDLHDIFALQERVADSVAAAIEPTLQLAEVDRLRHAGPRQPGAYDLLLRALGLVGHFTAGSMEEALECLDRSLQIDPDFPRAMATAAYCRAQCHFQGWAHQAEEGRAAAVHLAWRAVDLAPGDAQVLWMAAFAIWNMDAKEGTKARELFGRSLVLNPNSAMALVLSGWIETMCGQIEEGRARVLRAQRLNPRDPRDWLMSGVMAIAGVIEEDFASAGAWAERALAQNRRFAVALRVLAVASVKLGQHARAERAVAELLEIEPDLTISGFFARIPVPLAKMAALYGDALKVAGLPE